MATDDPKGHFFEQPKQAFRTRDPRSRTRCETCTVTFYMDLMESRAPRPEPQSFARSALSGNCGVDLGCIVHVTSDSM